MIAHYGMDDRVLISASGPLARHRECPPRPHLWLGLRCGSYLCQAKLACCVQNVDLQVALRPAHHPADAIHLAWAQVRDWAADVPAADEPEEMRRLPDSGN